MQEAILKLFALFMIYVLFMIIAAMVLYKDGLINFIQNKLGHRTDDE